MQIYSQIADYANLPTFLVEKKDEAPPLIMEGCLVFLILRYFK